MYRWLTVVFDLYSALFIIIQNVQYTYFNVRFNVSFVEPINPTLGSFYPHTRLKTTCRDYFVCTKLLYKKLCKLSYRLFIVNENQWNNGDEKGKGLNKTELDIVFFCDSFLLYYGMLFLLKNKLF